MKPESNFSPEINYTTYSEAGSVSLKDNIYHAITHDGKLDVPIPTDIAGHISLMIKLQDKAVFDGDADAQIVLQTFNCRKSALVASGAIPLEESIVDMSNSSGEEEMFEDVNRILKNPNGMVTELKNYQDFVECLHEYKGSFPCMVHIFESDMPIKSFEDEFKTLHRVHSFLVLGEDEALDDSEEDVSYVCFQKMGPSIDQPFLISDFSFVTASYDSQDNRTGYFVYGPYK